MHFINRCIWKVIVALLHSCILCSLSLQSWTEFRPKATWICENRTKNIFLQYYHNKLLIVTLKNSTRVLQCFKTLIILQKCIFANTSFVFLLRCLLKLERTFLPLLYFCVCNLKCTFNRENPQGRPGVSKLRPAKLFPPVTKTVCH